MRDQEKVIIRQIQVVIDAITVEIPNSFKSKGRWYLIKAERPYKSIYIEIHQDNIIEILS